MTKKERFLLWASRNWGFIFFGLVTIILVTIVLCLAPDFPLKKDKEGQYTRDWLSIVADLGKALGGFAFILLLFQIAWKEKEEKKERTPALEFKDIELISTDLFESMEKPPHVVLCVEANRDDIEAIPSLKGYDKFYQMLEQNQRENPRKYLKITIQNNNNHYLAIAKNLRPILIIELLQHEKDMRSDPCFLQFPRNKILNVSPGEIAMIFINFSLNAPTSTEKKNFRIGVKDFTCTNGSKMTIKGSKVDFTVESKIPSTALTINNTTTI